MWHVDSPLEFWCLRDSHEFAARNRYLECFTAHIPATLFNGETVVDSCDSACTGHPIRWPEKDSLTLAQWEVLYNCKPDTLATRSVCVPISLGEKGYRELWQLSDYFVMSVSGGAVWLSPRIAPA